MMTNSTVVDRVDAFIRFFLYILIFWLPYSPAVVETCVIFILMLWLLKRGILLAEIKGPAKTVREKLFRLFKGIKPESSFLNKPIGFFMLACILSVTGSAFFEQSLRGFFTKTLEWFIVYFLVIEVFKDKRHVIIALGILIFTAFSTGIDSLVQFYITHKDIFLGHVIEPGDRPSAGFKTPNGLGGYLTGIVPGLSAWVLLGKQKFSYRVVASFILLLLTWSLILTFSRGAWFGTFLGGTFLLFLILFPGKRSHIYLSLGMFGAVIFLSLALVFIVAHGSGQTILERFETIQWRLGIWNVSFEMIRDKPFFGHGINTFMKIFQAYRGESVGPTYAHNCFIQLAAETGIAGLFCFLWIVATMFHESLGKLRFNFEKDRSLGALAVGLLAGIFAFLVHSFFDAHFYSLQLSVYLWFVVGVLVATCKISDAPEERKIGF